MRITESSLRSIIRNIINKDYGSDQLTAAQRQVMLQNEKEVLESLLENIKNYLEKKTTSYEQKINLYDNLSMAARNFREKQLEIGNKLGVDVGKFTGNLGFWKDLYNRVSEEPPGGLDIEQVANEMRKSI